MIDCYRGAEAGVIFSTCLLYLNDKSGESCRSIVPFLFLPFFSHKLVVTHGRYCPQTSSIVFVRVSHETPSSLGFVPVNTESPLTRGLSRSCLPLSPCHACSSRRHPYKAPTHHWNMRASGQGVLFHLQVQRASRTSSAPPQRKRVPRKRGFSGRQKVG
jgi:hypothetical protein